MINIFYFHKILKYFYNGLDNLHYFDLLAHVHASVAILIQKRRRKLIQKQLWAVNHGCNCASKTLDTVYSLSLISQYYIINSPHPDLEKCCTALAVYLSTRLQRKHFRTSANTKTSQSGCSSAAQLTTLGRPKMQC